VKDGIDWQKFPFSGKNCKKMKSLERLLIPAFALTLSVLIRCERMEADGQERAAPSTHW
jgi:hypothetical protein